jgi:Flp pilus assembly protein protease CpaA
MVELLIALPFLLINSYTDIKKRLISNVALLFFMLILLVLAIIKGLTFEVMRATIIFLIIGLLAESKKFWYPGDTKLLALCGGWASLLGLNLFLYLGIGLVLYSIVGAACLYREGKMGMPNLYSLLIPALRGKTIYLPGAPIISLALVLTYLISWGWS